LKLTQYYLIPHLGNRAKVGGGLLIIVANEGLNVEDCIFETNSALLAGGAVSVLSNNVNLKFKGKE
jgi:hypothetical protein